MEKQILRREKTKRIRKLRASYLPSYKLADTEPSFHPAQCIVPCKHHQIDQMVPHSFAADKRAAEPSDNHTLVAAVVGKVDIGKGMEGHLGFHIPVDRHYFVVPIAHRRIAIVRLTN